METLLFLIYMAVFLSAYVAVLVFAWGILGLIVGVIHFVLWPPPPPPPGPCENCARMQALWDDMNGVEHAFAFANFLTISAICAASRCGWLNLTM